MCLTVFFLSRMGNTFLSIACREGYLALVDYLLSEAVSLGVAGAGTAFAPLTIIVNRYATWGVSSIPTWARLEVASHTHWDYAWCMWL